MGFWFDENYDIRWKRLLSLFIASCLFGVPLLETPFALYVNGVPRTHNGHIIYISYHYNKLYDYKWTDVEVLTYSGDSHHIRFWGHPDFELNTNYRFHTEIKNRFYLLPFPSWEGKELITEVEIIVS